MKEFKKELEELGFEINETKTRYEVGDGFWCSVEKTEQGVVSIQQYCYRSVAERACRGNDVRLLSCVIEKINKGFIDYTNGQNYRHTVLGIAVSKNAIDCVKLLIPVSDVNNDYNGYVKGNPSFTALEIAAYQNNSGIIDLLIPYIDKDFQTSRFENTGNDSWYMKEAYFHIQHYFPDIKNKYYKNSEGKNANA